MKIKFYKIKLVMILLTLFMYFACSYPIKQTKTENQESRNLIIDSLKNINQNININFSDFNFFIGAIQGCKIHIDKLIIIGEETNISNGYEILIQNNDLPNINLITISDSLKIGNWKAIIIKLPKKSKTPTEGESEFDNWEYDFPCHSELYLYQENKFHFVKKEILNTEEEVCEYKKQVLDNIK